MGVSLFKKVQIPKGGTTQLNLNFLKFRWPFHCLSCRRHLRTQLGSLSRIAQIRLTGGPRGCLASAGMDVHRQSFWSHILSSWRVLWYNRRDSCWTTPKDWCNSYLRRCSLSPSWSPFLPESGRPLWASIPCWPPQLIEARGSNLSKVRLNPYLNL